jgi:cation diffusion facilitator family transporter
MKGNALQLESRALSLSALLALGFALMGIVIGLSVGSIVILFDGAYSLVSLALTLLSLAAAKIIARPSPKRFPNGLAALEPVVIAIKATVILAVVIACLYSAVESILMGGRPVDASIATVFGLINVVVCAIAWMMIAKKSKQLNSGLLNAETKQWQMDTLISLAVLIGFIVAWGVAQTTLSPYAVYADPAMMLLMGGYFLKVPFDMLKSAVLELLHTSASTEVCKQVNACVSESNDQQPSMNLQVSSVMKVGQELRVNVDLQLAPTQTIAPKEIERTRHCIARNLQTMPYKLQLNLSLVA